MLLALNNFQGWGTWDLNSREDQDKVVHVLGYLPSSRQPAISDIFLP